MGAVSSCTSGKRCGETNGRQPEQPGWTPPRTTHSFSGDGLPLSYSDFHVKPTGQGRDWKAEVKALSFREDLDGSSRYFLGTTWYPTLLTRSAVHSIRVQVCSQHINWTGLDWTGLNSSSDQVCSNGSVHNARTNSAPTVRVPLQAIKLPRRRAWQMHASCNCHESACCRSVQSRAGKSEFIRFRSSTFFKNLKFGKVQN